MSLCVLIIKDSVKITGRGLAVICKPIYGKFKMGDDAVITCIDGNVKKSSIKSIEMINIKNETELISVILTGINKEDINPEDVIVCIPKDKNNSPE